MIVELPVAWQHGRSGTMRVAVDTRKIFLGRHSIGIGRDGTSTHSRDGDGLADRLKENVPGAFAVVGTSGDIFRRLEPPCTATRPSGTTPYELRVSQRLPKFALPAENPLTREGVELGRRLFFEGRLSSNDRQSCASCHAPDRAFSDSKPTSAGAEGQAGRRNAMPLFNLAWQEAFFWDGRVTTLRDQVLHPITDPKEMNQPIDRAVAKIDADESYRAEFAKAFGSPGVTDDRIGKALEQFLMTEISQDSKFDRAARGLVELTAEEKRGLQLFVTERDPARGLRGADCFHCHGGNLFTTYRFANNGLDERADDAGRFEVTGNEGDRGKFKVPSLRNVALTAPYGHDGRFATLEEVIGHYSSGVRGSPTLDPNLAKHPPGGLGFSSEETRALVAFLRTLTDARFLPAVAPTVSASRTP